MEEFEIDEISLLVYRVSKIISKFS